MNTPRTFFILLGYHFVYCFLVSAAMADQVEAQTKDPSYSMNLYEKTRSMLWLREQANEGAEQDKLSGEIIKALMETNVSDFPNHKLISWDDALAIALQRMGSSHREQIASISIKRIGALIVIEFTAEQLPPDVLGSINIGSYEMDGYTGAVLRIVTGG
jgi:hypothetical protein